MFDFKRFLVDRFGNARGLIAFLNSYGAPAPEQGTAEKWFLRGSVPGDWFAVLLAYIELEDGKPARLAKYIKTA